MSRYTIQDAAALLCVSREYILRLVKGKDLPTTKVGGRRYVEYKNLIECKSRVDASRRKTLVSRTTGVK